jgi:hypothetical protein
MQLLTMVAVRAEQRWTKSKILVQGRLRCEDLPPATIVLYERWYCVRLSSV